MASLLPAILKINRVVSQQHLIILRRNASSFQLHIIILTQTRNAPFQSLHFPVKQLVINLQAASSFFEKTQ